MGVLDWRLVSETAVWSKGLSGTCPDLRRIKDEEGEEVSSHNIFHASLNKNRLGYTRISKVGNTTF